VTAFPEWQNTCVQIVKDSYTNEIDKVDDMLKVKELLDLEKGLIKVNVRVRYRLFKLSRTLFFLFLSLEYVLMLYGHK